MTLEIFGGTGIACSGSLVMRMEMRRARCA